MNICTCCSSSIPEGQSVCSMCYGDPHYGNDGYYMDYLRRQEEQQQDRLQQEQRQFNDEFPF